MSDNLSIPSRPKRVVILEDEVISALHLKKHLQQAGYVVDNPILRSSLDLEKILSPKPDILFVDINLGIDMDGIELAKQISSNQPIPIVLITGYGATEIKNRAASLPIVGILEKPVRTPLLQEILRKAGMF